MKNLLSRYISGFLTVISIYLLLPWGATSAADVVVPPSDKINRYIREIIDSEVRKSGADGIQQFINGKASENAAGMYDWFVYALMQNQSETDFSVYEAALKTNSADKTSNAVEKERIALILSAFDGNEEQIRYTLDTCADGLGIMSEIFALHLVNNGYSTEKTTADTVIKAVLSMQTPDGGWSLNGKKAAPDETAMALQALSPYYGKNDEVTAAVDKALAVLSDMQTENGGYVSYGSENSESCAQVVIALCSLDISPFEDERFFKNGDSVCDALLRFRMEDGSFEHISGKGYNFKATEQALSAFIAVTRMFDGKAPFYCADKHTVSQAAQPVKNSKLPLIAAFCAAGLVFLILTVVFFKKKNKLSNVFLILLVVTAAAGFFVCSDIQSPEDYYTVTTISDPENGVTAHISITCDTIKDKAAKNSNVPENGIILADTELTLPEGSTVYDFLIYAAKQNGIQLENDSVSASSAYITGIQYLYQFDFGPLSGWMFTVNGKIADVGCGEYTVSDGDEIKWLYTCSLGEDLSLTPVK